MVHGPTLPAGIPPVPSALPRFTTRFGMGRGGSTARNAHHWLRGQCNGKCFWSCYAAIVLAHRSSLREALVHALPSPARVTTLPARAACPVISWGTYPPDGGECTHLAVHFPLRCFQRFLLPDIATQPAGRPTTAPPAVRPRRSSRTKRSSPQDPKRP